MAGSWRYFLTRPGRVTEAATRVFRLREGAPLLTLQMAGSGVWSLSDQMHRAHFLGSDDDEFHEVDRAEALAVLQQYVDLGYFTAVPDLDDPGPDEDFVTAAREIDDRAERIWSQVPRPPGAGTSVADG